jgi:hypothetical protein
MKTIILALILSVATAAVAGELDNDQQVANQGLQQTVVVRVDTRDQSVAVLNSQQTVTSEAQAKGLSQQNFTNVPTDKVRTELDHDGGASSWYVYWGYHYGYSYPSYYWYGACYHPYYNWGWGYYHYYYYGAYYPWWR